MVGRVRVGGRKGRSLRNEDDMAMSAMIVRLDRSYRGDMQMYSTARIRYAYDVWRQQAE
jgi:hypothetical protein